MSGKLKRSLPTIIVTAAAVALAAVVFSVPRRQAMLADTGATRPAVEAAVARIEALRPTAAADPTLRQALDAALHAPYVATLWLFDPGGRLVYAAGSTAQSVKDSASAAASAETQRVLASIPTGTLSDQQRVAILAASAIQAEGEHNDVYRHLLRPLKGPDGATVALLGVAYEVSPAVGGSPSAGWIAGLLALALGLGVYWLALPLWVYLDATERGERAWAWAAFVLIGNLVGLLAYILARSPQAGATANG